MPVIGPFNRRVVLETKTVTQDETGFPVEQWLAARTMWAHRRDATANERFRSSQELAQRTSVFTVRWFRELNAGDWRIVHEDLIWDIEGIAEPPRTRRQYWELTCTAGHVSEAEAGPIAPLVDTEAPTVPENLSAAAVSASAIDLTWDASTDNVAVTGYNIYRDAVLIDTSTTLAYSDTGLADATEYSYQISAFDAEGNESGLSSPSVATTGYTANAVHADGTNDYSIRGAGLTGAVDSKLGTGSLWARRTATGTVQRILYGTGAAFSVYFGADNKFSIVGENSAGSVILLMSSVVTITDTNWHHFVWSFDTADNSKNRIYVDDVASVSATCSNAAVDFTITNWGLCARETGAEKYAGDLADMQVWFAKYLDLSVEGNRRLFVTATGQPVNPATAEASALGAPIVRQRGATGTWHVNDGTGGGFTMNGLLTDGQAPVEF